MLIQVLRNFSAAILALFILGSGLGAVNEPEELTKLRQRFEGQKTLIMAEVGVLNQKYLAALARLEESETTKGNLQAVLAVRKEIENQTAGGEYDPAAFEARMSEHEKLRKLQTTYRDARLGIVEEKKEEITALAGKYSEQLRELSVELTKASRIEDALMVTREIKRIQEESTSAVAEMAEAEPIRARAHCTAKAVAELYLNGEPIHLRLSNPDDDGGTDGKSPFFDIREGDFVVVRLRGNAVYRSLALAFELPDEDRVLFFQSADFKVVGQGADADPLKIDREVIEASPKVNPLPTVPDDYWVNRWHEHRLDGGGFLKPEPQGEWTLWGSILTAEMLVRKGK